MRWLSLVLALSAIVPAHGASLRDMQLQKMLEEVAILSSEGTPRAINEELEWREILRSIRPDEIHLVLPALALASIPLAIIVRITRASVAEVLN